MANKSSDLLRYHLDQLFHSCLLAILLANRPFAGKGIKAAAPGNREETGLRKVAAGTFLGEIENEDPLATEIIRHKWFIV